MVREQQTIIVLPDPSQMQVKAKINESRITLVREGMAARIQVNAVQGQSDLLGQVTKVNKYAEPGSWYSSSVKEYATFIQIMNPPETIRTGMTAEVRIFVEQLEDAVQAPILAIHEVKGHHFVLVKDGAQWATKEVKIGATNDKYVTILEGVAEGTKWLSILANIFICLIFLRSPTTWTEANWPRSASSRSFAPIRKDEAKGAW